MTPEPIDISFSELDAYRQCPHKWMLSYKERWTTRSTSPALSRGTLFHKLMEYHYRHLQYNPHDLAGAQQAASEALHEWGKECEPEVVDLVWWMYEGYVEKWGSDDHWEIVAVEQRMYVPLPTAGGQRSRFRLKMGIDLLVKDQSMHGRLFLIDHKSGANLPTRKAMDMSDQFGLYQWGLLKLGHPVLGAAWNAARTKRNIKPMALDERFGRYLMSKSETELEAIARDAYSTARLMYSRANRGERNPDPDTCSWKCGYVDACTFGRKTDDTREREYLQDAGFEQDYTRH